MTRGWGLTTDLFIIATEHGTCYEVALNRYHDVRRLYRQHHRSANDSRIESARLLFAAFAAGVSVGALLMLSKGSLYLG